MRTENPTSSASAVGRLMGQLARARRRLRDQTPSTRWALILGAGLLLVAVVYLAMTPASPGGGYLYDGQRFSADDVIKITHALAAKQVNYRVDDQSRIKVDADNLGEATAIVDKLEVGPRSIADIEKKWEDQSSIWDGPSEKEYRQTRAQEKKLATWIGRLPGIISADVKINRIKGKSGLRPVSSERAFVYLQTEGGRKIGYDALQGIRNILLGSEFELKEEGLTVVDQKGNHYLDAGNPKLGVISLTRAREEELTQKILDHLDWIKGVGVTVQLIPASVPQAQLQPQPQAAPPTPALPPEPGPSVGVNQPLEIAPEPQPTAVPAPAPPVVASEPQTPRPPAETTHARVLVRVPRSYYLKLMPKGEPSMEDLQSFISRTEKSVQETISHVIPPTESHEVSVRTIPDDLGEVDPLASTAAPDSHRSFSWWIPAGVAGAVLVSLTAAGLCVLASRRPAIASMRADRGRFKIDSGSEPGPGPSERVRELVRLNPESAASILQRWIGQGGHAA